MSSSRLLSAIALALALTTAALLPSSPARAGGTQSGLAVAITSDGSQLVAGGSNRVLYELDPATLAVKRRVHLGRQIMKMAWAPSGSVLVVESTKAVQFLKSDTLEPFQTMKDAERMTPVPSLGAVVVLTRGREPAFRILGFDDGKEKASVPFDRTQSIAAFGVSQDGKKLAMLYYRRTDASEEKVAWKDIPKELTEKRDAALREYQQRHDGYMAKFVVVEIASGKTVLEKKLWYAPADGNNMLVWQGDDVYVVGYQNQNARISQDGEVSYFELENGYNYAFQPSADGAAFWTGGLRKGTRTKVEGLAAAGFEVDALPGFPEYYKTFSVTADGTAFAGTTAFRVVHLTAEGKVAKIAPVY